MIQVKNKKGNIVKIFANTFENEAFEQVKKLANYEPYLDSKIRIMPDGHAGAGCVIGTTIQLTDKVTPNLVGVDIGCLDKDTEYLTPTGWRKMNDYNDGDKVLGFNPETGLSEFVHPLAYIVKECSEFYHFKNQKGLDQMVSEEHKMLVYKGFRGRGYTHMDCKPTELAEMKLGNGFYSFETTFIKWDTSVKDTFNQIRIAVMIAADGRIRKLANGNNSLELHFKKERKIKRAEELLNLENIKYSKNVRSDGSTAIYAQVPDMYNKDLTKYYKASSGQLDVLATESLAWDGHEGYRSFFSSTNKKNADVIQYAFHASGCRAGLTRVESKQGHKPCYIVTPTQNSKVAYSEKPTKVKSEDGKKYCFTMPQGYFVARRNGKIFITGNCGMLCIRLAEKEIDFKKLDDVIRTYVPSGFDIHDTPHAYFNFEGLECAKHVDLSRALKSIGSLGGGNHFIEVDYSEKDECYYLVIHSGSRNLGVQVCKYYQDKAYNSLISTSSVKTEVIRRLKIQHREKEINDIIKKIKTPEVVKELAYLTPETGFYEYINDMGRTQNYAALNRNTIAVIIMDHMGWSITDEFHTIHNYIDTENMILRKGAVSAQKGEKLIIPMNMRDGSLICVGKGNSDWNFSAPHGAGRLMSRSKAKECISMDEFQASMSEVYTTSVCESTIDESPQAYKPTEEIMSLVTDTVDVIDVIKPVYNFKAS